MGEAEDGPPGSVELSAGIAGGSRCTGQASTPGFRPPRWVRGRYLAGVPQGDAPGLGGEARGGRAEGVSVAVSPWTRLSRKPEKRVCLSAAREDLGGSLSLSLSEPQVKPSPPEMPEQLSTFTEAGVSGADPALSWGAGDLWATRGLQLGLELGDAGQPRSLWPSWFPPLWVIHPRRGGGRGSSTVSPKSWHLLPWLFGTGVGACAVVDFSSRCSFRVRLDF